MMVFFLVGMVITMVFYQVFGSLKFFGSWGGISDIPPASIGSFQFIHKPELYYMGLFFLAITLVVYYLLYNSKIGTAWNAIGSSLKLANSVGIDIVKYRFVNILIGNFFLAYSRRLLCRLVSGLRSANFQFQQLGLRHDVCGRGWY